MLQECKTGTAGLWELPTEKLAGSLVPQEVVAPLAPWWPMDAAGLEARRLNEVERFKGKM